MENDARNVKQKELPLKKDFPIILSDIFVPQQLQKKLTAKKTSDFESHF